MPCVENESVIADCDTIEFCSFCRLEQQYPDEGYFYGIVMIPPAKCRFCRKQQNYHPYIPDCATSLENPSYQSEDDWYRLTLSLKISLLKPDEIPF